MNFSSQDNQSRSPEISIEGQKVSLAEADSVGESTQIGKTGA